MQDKKIKIMSFLLWVILCMLVQRSMLGLTHLMQIYSWAKHDRHVLSLKTQKMFFCKLGLAQHAGLSLNLQFLTQ